MNPFAESKAEAGTHGAAAGTVAALGEVELLRRVRGWLGSSAPPPPAGMGDDCAVLGAGAGSPDGLNLVTVDGLIYGRHFDASVEPARAGAKLLKRNLSDIAAMGGRPGAAVVALALPGLTLTDWLEGFYGGLREAAETYGVAVVGGDLAGSDHDLVAYLTLWGRAARPVARRGAVLGDTLWVTGDLGASLPSGKHLDFTPRLEEGAWLAGRAEVHAMIDLSDGLGKDLPELLPVGLAAAVDVPSVPVSAAARAAAGQGGRSALERAFGDGEDYELLFALDAAADAGRFAADWCEAHPATALTCIGRVVEGPGPGGARLLDARDGKPFGAAAGGYEHFAIPRRGGGVPGSAVDEA